MSFHIFKTLYLVFFFLLGLLSVALHSAPLLALFAFGLLVFIVTLELLEV